LQIPSQRNENEGFVGDLTISEKSSLNYFILDPKSDFKVYSIDWNKV
jgi:hypothetical protein